MSSLSLPRGDQLLLYRAYIEIHCPMFRSEFIERRQLLIELCGRFAFVLLSELRFTSSSVNQQYKVLVISRVRVLRD